MQLVENHERERKLSIATANVFFLIEFDWIFSELSQLIQQNYLEKKKKLPNSDFNPSGKQW